MAASAALRGALVGLVPLVIWWLVGKRRRRELVQHARKLRLLEVGLGLALAAALWWQPWKGTSPASWRARTGSRSPSSSGPRCRCPPTWPTSRCWAT